MKNVIAIAKNGSKNGGLLTIENIDKTAITEIAKVSSTIDLGNKYS